ncbi:MAG TPA: CotH kinase family protein [Planctomycetota bacterium]|nr:CotH kinase family protein [Planctomycetota bacterium]
MRAAIGALWRWSWLATVPASALFVLWATQTFTRWRNFAVDYDSRPEEPTLLSTGIDQWRALSRQIRLRLSSAGLEDVPADLQLRSIQLFVADADLAKLDEDLPYSGLEYVDGLLVYPDGLHKVSVRYRGDFLKHWGYDKKSIRVRTKATDLFGGFRSFNLIVPKFPEQLNNYLAYRLATTLGLIAPHCELVNVFLNGRNTGLHEFTEQLDEGTLRRHDRMPGDLYAGELISKSQYAGMSNDVFDHPLLWEKVAANNHYDLDSHAPLEALTTVLRGSPSEASQAELSRLLDMDAWGRFGAFELLTQTHHFDEVHNWRLFWDPWRLKFEPVVWDPTGWAPDWRPADGPISLDVMASRINLWLVTNGDYLAARHAALRDFFGSGKAERFLGEFNTSLLKAAYALQYDPNLLPTDPDAVFGSLANFRPYVDQVFAQLRAAYFEGGDVRWARVDDKTVRLQVTGRRPVSSVLVRFERELAPSVSTRLRYERLGETIDVDLTAGTVERGNTLRVPARLFCQLVPEFRCVPAQALRNHMRAAAPGTYELQFDGVPAGNRVLEVATVRDDQEQSAELVADLPQADLEFVYRATPPLRNPTPQTWRGDVVVEGVREVFDDVVIEPGTTVRLGANACILFRGRVLATGSREHPIRFLPMARDQDPWGTVALNSPDCRGSRFQWCEMRGGSGHKSPVEEYTSMFSIHNCVDVRVEDCRFAENHVVDDMVHVMYSSVVFDRVTLDTALADALDCDISTVVVRNSAFPRSGNDGVDLMTCHALVEDCSFEGNEDKGISIGESSYLVVLRSRFDGCVKALEAKDGSIACAANCEVRHCKKVFNAYKKNWRYGSGGYLTMYKSIVLDNDALQTADRWSRAELVDCQVKSSGSLVDHYEQDYVDGTSRRMKNMAHIRDSSDGKQPSDQAPLPFPSDLEHLRDLAGQAWSSVQSGVRGVPDAK